MVLEVMAKTYVIIAQIDSVAIFVQNEKLMLKFWNIKTIKPIRAISKTKEKIEEIEKENRKF